MADLTGLYRVDQESGCWIWQRGTHAQGRYGKQYANGKLLGAHRWMYEQLVGPIPAGLEIDHLCRVTLCVNPAHLEPVTHRENVLRSTNFAAANAAKTHCLNGHEFTPQNTYNPPGCVDRQCKACRNERNKRSQAAKRRARNAPQRKRKPRKQVPLGAWGW